MTRGAVAVVGAAESTDIGHLPDVANLDINADAAINAMNDAGLKPADIDGISCGYQDVTELASYLGINPQWAENTTVGGSSYMLHLRHAAAAIEAGHCTTVLLVHGESGRSYVGGPYRNWDTPASLGDQFVRAYADLGPVSHFCLPVARYMHEYGLTMEQLASVAVVQREWAGRNPRAFKRDPLTIEQVLNSKMISWPFTRDMVCLVCDGGGAMVLTTADRANDFPNKPVYVLGTGEATEGPLYGACDIADPLRPEFVRVSGQKAFTEAGISHSDVDHLMIYDAFAHTPIFGLEGLGFVDYGEAGSYIADGNTAANGILPMNTNGGGLSYAHTGSYSMLLMQEAIRQLRGQADAQVEGANISVCHGWGGMWSNCATVVFGNEI